MKYSTAKHIMKVFSDELEDGSIEALGKINKNEWCFLIQDTETADRLEKRFSSVEYVFNDDHAICSNCYLNILETQPSCYVWLRPYYSQSEGYICKHCLKKEDPLYLLDEAEQSTAQETDGFLGDWYWHHFKHQFTLVWSDDYQPEWERQFTALKDKYNSFQNVVVPRHERYCEDGNYQLWVHTSSLVHHKLNELLSGSGFNQGWDEPETTKDGFIIASGYHCMNEDGFYDGWAMFKARFYWKDTKAFKLSFTSDSQYKARRYMLREFIEESIHHAITSE